MTKTRSLAFLFATLLIALIVSCWDEQPLIPSKHGITCQIYTDAQKTKSLPEILEAGKPTPLFCSNRKAFKDFTFTLTDSLKQIVATGIHKVTDTSMVTKDSSYIGTYVFDITGKVSLTVTPIVANPTVDSAEALLFPIELGNVPLQHLR